jgi:hypothetical protein
MYVWIRQPVRLENQKMKDLQVTSACLDVRQVPYLLVLVLHLTYGQMLAYLVVTETPQRVPVLGRLAPHQ